MSPYILYNNMQKIFIFFMAVIFLRVCEVMMDKYSCTVAKFIVPDWGAKVNSGMGCRTGPPGYLG